MKYPIGAPFNTPFAKPIRFPVPILRQEIGRIPTTVRKPKSNKHEKDKVVHKRNWMGSIMWKNLLFVAYINQPLEVIIYTCVYMEYKEFSYHLRFLIGCSGCIWGWNTKVADLSPRHFRKQAARDDATRRMEKILVKPGFGGLIQCQIYNPAIAPFFVGHSP